jgi:uncharacterized protein
MKKSIYNISLNINGNDILYNTFSGKSIKLTPEIDQCINGILIDQKLEDKLERNGFIVKDDINEINLIKGFHLQKRYSTRKYLLIINTSLDCNLNCWYCYESHIPQSHMSSDLVQRILKHIDLKYQIEPFETLDLSFFGGEPMINYKAISELLNGIKEQINIHNFKIRLTFTTNGTLITPKYIKMLSPFSTNFQITIDGDKNMHDSIRNFKKEQDKSSYDCILNGLRLLSNANANFHFIIRINYDEKILEHITSLIHDLSFLNKKRSVISLQKIWQSDTAQIDISKVLKAIEIINNAGFRADIYTFVHKYESCYADNLNQAIINYDGKVFKCTARNFIKEKPYGYLNSLGIIEWNTELVQKRLSLNIPQKCIDCKLFPCCFGFCSQKLIENGNKDLTCPFDERLSIEDIILLNIKQQLIIKQL